MEDEDLTNDQHIQLAYLDASLRERALAFAIIRASGKDYSPHFVVEHAETFYEFLTGGDE